MEASLLSVSYTVTSTSETMTRPFSKISMYWWQQKTHQSWSDKTFSPITHCSYIIDNQNNSWIQTHTHIRLHSKHSPNNSSLDITTRSGVGALTIHNNNQPTIGPQPNIQTLDQKLNWLKWSVGLLLPSHPNHDKLEATADLIRYADIIGTKNGIKGTFIRAVCIPTNGQSHAQKQHPVAQALEADIDAEIKHILRVSLKVVPTPEASIARYLPYARKTGRSAW